MTTEANKAKLLHLVQQLYEQTDELHGVTMPEIIEYLSVCGICAERKAVYRDIEVLRDFGLHIEKVRNKTRVEYRLVNRTFSTTELLLLIDAVQSTRFLTKSKSDKLANSIKSLGSKHQILKLNKHILVTNRIKMQNESVFKNVDVIREALRQKRKVAFRYFKYGANKKRVYGHEGATYVETPVYLIFSDGFYYLIAYNEKYEDFVNYRVDRMEALGVSDEAAARNERIAEFDPKEIERRAFSMYAGEPVRVTLEVQPSAMSVMIDRFGKDVATQPGKDDLTLVFAAVMESPTFYGWLAQLGTQVKVVKPQRVADNYRVFLQGILDATANSQL